MYVNDEYVISIAGFVDGFEDSGFFKLLPHKLFGSKIVTNPCPVGAVFAVVVLDRKSTRLNSSHVAISYAVFCLKKKNITTATILTSCLSVEIFLLRVRRARMTLFPPSMWHVSSFCFGKGVACALFVSYARM